MAFLFGKSKLNNEELNQCISWLSSQYEITTFQEREVDQYNNALVKYGGSLSTDGTALYEMVKIAERLVQSATELVYRNDGIESVPVAASTAHFAWRTAFMDYLAWATAQCSAFQAVADGMMAREDYVVQLLQKADNSRVLAEKEERELLKRMMSSGFKMNDLVKLAANTAKTVADKNRQTARVHRKKDVTEIKERPS